MERRRFQRKNVQIETEIIVEDSSYSGLINNLTERGIGLETESTNPLKNTTRFTPGTKLHIRFKMLSEELITLNCKVIWSFKTGPHGLKKRIGLEVIFPPPAYIEFCREL